MHKLFALLVPALAACSVAPSPTDGPPYAAASTTLSLHPAVAADYVELRAELPIASTDGEPCFTYDHRDSCLTWLGEQHSAGFANAARPGSFLVTTSGGHVAVIADEDSLRAFLGTIDTPDEALLLVTLLAAGPSDATAYDSTSNVVATDDGYDVWAWAPSCSGPRERPVTRYHVTSDGVITIVASDIACPFVYPIF